MWLGLSQLPLLGNESRVFRFQRSDGLGAAGNLSVFNRNQEARLVQRGPFQLQIVYALCLARTIGTVGQGKRC